MDSLSSLSNINNINDSAVDSFGNIILTNPNYMNKWQFEDIDINYWRLWVHKNTPLYMSAVVAYVAFIFFGQIWMKNRTPFNLKKLLLFWNAGLAIFSFFGFLRTYPELFNVLKAEDGFYKSICVWDHHSQPTALWGLFFTLSKIFELFDTAFIILKRQKLIFLHWYHHITVLSYVWLTYLDYEPRVRYFMVMNYFIHSLMYSYFALRTLNFKIPKSYSMLLTSLQISQMFLGLIVNFYGLYAKLTRSCRSEYSTLYAALLMYASYMYLFGIFFKNAYFNKINVQETKKKA